MKNLFNALSFCFYILTFTMFVGCSDENLTENPASKPTTSKGGDDFKTIRERISSDLAASFAMPDIKESLELFDNDKGKFTDLDYKHDGLLGAWPAMSHIDRLYNFAFAYTSSTNSYYQNEDVYNSIVKGLEYWYEINPTCANWWYNQIGEPQKIGALLVQMRFGIKKIPAELEAKTLKRIKDECWDPAGQAGANRTDMALHWVYRSCLEENEADMDIALINLFEPLDYTTKEGLQHDNSFTQHGPQLYIGGYGDDLLKGITQVAVYLKDTKYELKGERLERLSKFMRQTYYPTIRGQYMLFDVLGRGITRNNITRKKDIVLPFAQRMLIIDPVHADEFQATIERLNGTKQADYGIKPAHTHYYRGDYTLHVRPQYTFDVRMVSTRTCRNEYGASENLKGYFMSDGCTNIVVKGDEYFNIFPCWNWTRIPGITCPQLSKIPLPVEWQTFGTSTFAGGVSDNMYGVSAYAYTDNYSGINTSAKKSWFFFDNEVVCLGAGIKSTSSFQVNTTVNQCLIPANASIQVSLKNAVSTIANKGETSYTSPDWVLHNGIGYVFPNGGNVYVRNERASGTWYSINLLQPTGTVQQDVFTVGFNHGSSPTNSTYAYIVVPTMNSAADLTQYSKNQDIEILSNTENIQVVRNKKLDICQMVFYGKGTFTHADITVTVDKGCTLMFRNISKKGGALFYIADPAQSQSRIQVKATIPAAFTGEKSITCDFTGTGVHAGSSRIYAL